MSKVSRDILKSFFQPGSRPSSANFISLIDSLLHYAEDRDSVGLKKYNATLYYMPGDATIFDSCIYEAVAETTGAFNPAHWNQISVLQAAPAATLNSFGSDYLLTESKEESFMSSDILMADKLALITGERSGTYRLAWSAVVHHQQPGGMGRFRLVNAGTSEVIGSSQVYKQHDTNERLHVGSFAKVILNGTSQEFKLQYQTLNNGMCQYIQDARIELIKISD